MAIFEKVVASGATSVLDLGTGPGEPATMIAKKLPNVRPLSLRTCGIRLLLETDTRWN